MGVVVFLRRGYADGEIYIFIATDTVTESPSMCLSIIFLGCVVSALNVY
jgi:hypothetical protein